MLQNRNQNIVKKLSKKILHANKMRNIFAILAIALTTLLITATITTGVTFYKTNKSYNVISTYGVNADGYINIDDKILDKLKVNKNIDKIGIEQIASFDIIKNQKLLGESVFLEVGYDKEVFDMMSILPIEGTYPKEANEAFVPTWVLDVLGIEKKVGQDITLDVVINDEVKSIDFKLCGYYESLVSRGSGRTRIFTSNKFIEKYKKDITNQKNTKTAYVTFKNINEQSSYEEVKTEIKEVAAQVGATKYKAHPKYDSENLNIPGEGIEQIAGFGLGILLMIFTGYLIIYNIFYISVNKDIRFYGLLKTIGTTSKQLKKIILKQALTLSIIGIPIGLALGYLVAKIIVPLALEPTIFANIVVISAEPYIFVLSVLFSIFTVFISCNKPGKSAGKVSPIEAVRYVSSDAKTSKKKSKKGVNGAKIYKIALGNILKNKKKVILSTLSISLSALIVIFTINATLGMDPKAHADTQLSSDISINNNISHFIGEEKYQPIEYELVEKVKELDAVKEAKPLYRSITPFKDGKIYGFGVDILLEGKLKEEIENIQGEKRYMGYSTYSTGAEDSVNSELPYINTEVNAINTDDLEGEVSRLDIADGKIDEEEFKKGNYIIYYSRSGENSLLKSGDNLPLTFIIRDENGNEKNVTREYKIMAIVSDPSNGEMGSDLGMLNIEENDFREIFTNYEDSISSIQVNLNEGVDLNLADKAIEELINDSGNYTLGYTSKNFYIEGIKEMKTIVMTIGMIISSILGLIGIINIVNTVFSSMISRKVELAMLESIGMTKKQLKKMILFEGVYYILLSALLIIPLGLVVSLIAPMVLPIYGGFNLNLYLITVGISLLTITILMLIVPIVGYDFVSKESIVERIKVVE